MKKCIIPYLKSTNQTVNECIDQAEHYENCGADELVICEFHEEEKIQEQFLMTVKSIVKAIDILVNVGVYVKRFEDVKKAFYTGAKSVIIRYEQLADKSVIEESIKRFGNEQIMVEVGLSCDKTVVKELYQSGVRKFFCAPVMEDIIESECEDNVIIYSFIEEDSSESIKMSLEKTKVAGVVTTKILADSIMSLKKEFNQQGIDVNTFESSLAFSEFKVDSNGLIPAIVQDYKTNEVLMLGYMNQESYQKTIETGRMTYYSRSRQELWIKGETSGHYQYVKELSIDCDKDTILAKVKQVGAACHTGNRSCFYTNLVEREYDSVNPYSVFEDVYNVIMDRKLHPKEGSYTNYLFDKGIDKILKKCGEEATEIVIAAKNPEVEELKYEISDFLYHCMVLMAERGVDWEDITKELAHRR